jgi:serine/threonine protein kinase
VSSLRLCGQHDTGSLLCLRAEIFKAVECLHDHGIYHYDLNETNIRYDPEKNRAWIIDFELSQTHECRHPPIEWASDPPRPGKFSCKELWSIGRSTQVWVDYGLHLKAYLSYMFLNVFFSGTWKFYLTRICINHIKSWKDLVRFARPFMPENEAQREAKARFGDLQKLKGRYISTT